MNQQGLPDLAFDAQVIQVDRAVSQLLFFSAASLESALFRGAHAHSEHFALILIQCLASSRVKPLQLFICLFLGLEAFDFLLLAYDLRVRQLCVLQVVRRLYQLHRQYKVVVDLTIDAHIQRAL